MKLPDEEILAAFGRQMTREVVIRLVVSEDPRGKDLQEFCRRTSEIAPKIKTVEDVEDTDSLPAIWIGDRFRYRGVPAGNELKPFLEAISYLDSPSSRVSGDIPDEFKTAGAPADLQLFVTPPCSFCPSVAARLLPLPFATTSIYLTVIDAFLFSELAAAQHIKSVPTLVLDDHLRWTGEVDINELGQAISSRDPAALGSETLGRILQVEGGAYELAGMMQRSGKIFPAFADLLSDERFTIRLAAMVAVEDLQQRDANLALQAVQPMLERYNHTVDAVKGDFLYLFGELRAAEALPLLQRAAADPNEEIREAAAEALDKVQR